MCVSQLIESLAGKVAAMSGRFEDSTTFSKSSQDPTERLAQQCEKYGYQRYGKERLYNGHTGEMIEALIYIGPTYYQRLKHLVQDKLHSRARGDSQLLF